jgi:hypothetical protein
MDRGIPPSLQTPTSSWYNNLIESTEKALDGIGLMTGNNAIQKRIAFGAIIGGLLVSYIKPDFMFENGVPRPWKVFPDKNNPITPTWIPWWIAPVLFAFFFGVCV